jgi:hypothetical protein
VNVNSASSTMSELTDWMAGLIVGLTERSNTGVVQD